MPNYDRVCADCVHSHKTRATIWECRRARNLVTGERPTAPIACVTSRSKTGVCGPDGRLYEQRNGKLEAAE